MTTKSGLGELEQKIMAKVMGALGDEIASAAAQTTMIKGGDFALVAASIASTLCVLLQKGKIIIVEKE